MTALDYDAIAEKLLKDIPPWNGTPFYALAAGGPASNKETLSALLNVQGQKGYITLSDDTVMEFLPKSDFRYPHFEKNADHIKEYYGLIEHIITAAAQKHISVIFEDHGDYPSEYKKHVAAVGKHGYESFLFLTTVSPANFTRRIDALMQQIDLPDFREWGRGYHVRVGQHVDTLTTIFDRGMIVEAEPPDISPDKKLHAFGVMRFDNTSPTPHIEVLDEQRYRTFQSWPQQHCISEDLQHVFRSADAVMEAADAPGRFAASVGRRTAQGDRKAPQKTILDDVAKGIEFGRG
jgi:hypothetical protein